MDKSWMHEPKFSPKYVDGVHQFIQFVHDKMGQNCNIRCPCRNCCNVRILNQEQVEDHLHIKGIMKSYTQWIYHGEQSDFNINGEHVQYHHDEAEIVHDDEENDEGLRDMLEDIIRGDTMDIDHGERSYDHVTDTNVQGEVDKFDKLLGEAQRELYPGCSKFSTLSFIVKLLHLKVYNHWSNKSFNMLLELLKDAFPMGETLPKTHYDALKMLRELGLGYELIHACKYDCVLFWKELKDENNCPECNTSRWKLNDGKGKKIPHKVLRYFPLKPRLQRLFMSRKTAKDMRWHYNKRVDDENILRHPADSKVWKEFDKQNEWFAKEPRNIRLGLATDGFNPFGNMSVSYRT